MVELEELRSKLNKKTINSGLIESLLPLSEELDKHIVAHMKKTIDLKPAKKEPLHKNNGSF